MLARIARALMLVALCCCNGVAHAGNWTLWDDFATVIGTGFSDADAACASVIEDGWNGWTGIHAVYTSDTGVYCYGTQGGTLQRFGRYGATLQCQANGDAGWFNTNGTYLSGNACVGGCEVTFGTSACSNDTGECSTHAVYTGLTCQQGEGPPGSGASGGSTSSTSSSSSSSTSSTSTSTSGTTTSTTTTTGSTTTGTSTSGTTTSGTTTSGTTSGDSSSTTTTSGTTTSGTTTSGTTTSTTTTTTTTSGTTTSGTTTSGTTSGDSSSTTTTSGTTTSGTTTSSTTSSGTTTSGTTTSGTTTSGTTTSGTTTSGTTTSSTTTSSTTTSGTTTSGTTTSGTTTSGTTTSGSTTTGSTTSGSTTTTGTSGTSGGDFCSQHPELSVCKTSHAGTDCASFSCDGDAIQCAILKLDWQRYCDDTKKTPQGDLGQALIDGNDPKKGELPSNENASVVDIGQIQISSTGFLGGGSCFPDKHFTVAGRDFTISFTQACDYLLALRYAIMVVALLVSFKMVSGVVMRDA